MGLPRGWVCYSAWNEAIRAHLFDGRFAGQPVYLDLDDDFVHANWFAFLDDDFHAYMVVVDLDDATMDATLTDLHELRIRPC